MATSRSKYGVDWPAGYPDEMIELQCAKKWKDLGRPDPDAHLLRACSMLFSKEQFAIHRWTEQHAHDFCKSDFCITWGAAATSKSNDYGLFVLLDWLVDPEDTIVLVGSTTKEALKKRSWESVLRYLSLLKKHPTIDFPGRSKSSGYAILNSMNPDDEAQGEKAGVFGVALDENGKLQGAHLKYVRVLVDEIATLSSEGAREAIETAISNLRKGATSFKFFGLANPESRFDLSGYYAEPIGGWSTVSVDHEEWATRFGMVRHHDGLKSPAITEPGGDKKYPFLINAEMIERDRVELGEDSPVFWRMNRGYPPRQGQTATVLTEADLVAGKATEKLVNGMSPEDMGSGSPFYQVVTVGALDSAFTQGGDAAILQGCKIINVNNLPTLFFPPKQKIPILDASDRPVSYQLVDAVRQWGLTNRVGMKDFAADDSGTQSICDILTQEIEPGVLRVNYSRQASELQVSVASKDEAKKKFKDVITEAWAILAEFIKAGQVRGLDEDCARQLVSRLYSTNKSGVVLHPQRLEKKTEYKARTKLGSPDEADAAAMVALLVRHRLGVVPGSGVYPSSLARSTPQEKPVFRMSSASSFRTDTPISIPLGKLMGKYLKPSR